MVFHSDFGLGKGSKKKIWNFPDLVLEKIIFSPLKMPKHFKKIWTLCWTNVSCHTLYGWHNARCADNNLRSAANMMRGAANTMSWCGRRNACEVLWVGQNQSWTPPYGKKLVSFKWIFRHFYASWEHFFIFLNLENGLFQTHPPTKSGKFHIFLNPSLSDNYHYYFIF